MKQNPKHDFDIIWIGGGLASTISCLWIAQRFPHLRQLVLEKSAGGCSDKTYSFHDGDLPRNLLAWARTLADYSYDGYDVVFPKVRRNFRSGYHTIHGHSLWQRLVGSDCVEVRTNAHVSLASNRVVEYDQNGQQVSLTSTLVFDSRYDAKSSLLPNSRNCFQTFVGTKVTTATPHGINRPLIMDTRIDQGNDYRFMYVLPQTDKSVFIEDTRYSHKPFFDETRAQAEIEQYGTEILNLDISGSEFVEKGSLPIPLYTRGIRFPAFSADRPIPIGVRSGLFQMTTGYSFPFALRFAAILARWIKQDVRGGPGMLAWRYQRRHWHRSAFYRRLNSMLFCAGQGSERVGVFEQFYRRNEWLIQRFYAGNNNILDKLFMLSGKPPVPLKEGVTCFFTGGDLVKN